jgi:membrane-bound ClpP family serine protease
VLPSAWLLIPARSVWAFWLFHVNVENPSTMVVFMALPILGFGFFYILPSRIATPIYLCLLVISGFMYYGMFTVMGRKRKVRTGFEEMIGREGLVFEDISPEGKVLNDSEIWIAKAQRAGFLKGDKVRICGHEGLTLIVEALNEKEKPV